jgi:cyclopropane-fatty-acyl-phospholipid synthase
MNLVAAAARLAERAPVPDAVSALGVSYLVERTRKRLLLAPEDAETLFVEDMRRRAIAEHTDAANAQHYELPAAFFGLVLGPRRKYSSCLYPKGSETLAQAEEHALAQTMAHADLMDGQRILELGCGWGSLSLSMAERFPNAQITGVSNSHSQRAHIMEEAARRGLDNVEIVTADMNVYETDARFDRIVSVEMFEHMSNWDDLLSRARRWLTPEGRLFLHVFTHRNRPYRFETSDKEDWIAQHFFTGGIMPSHKLITHFAQHFMLEREWRWSGAHYERTALQWLENFDAHREEIRALMRTTYGEDHAIWTRRWRLFFLATAGLFGHRGGEEWGVSHYLLRPTR